MTVVVPSGATSDAGAQPYAEKFPTSPNIMRDTPTHQSGFLVQWILTSRSSFFTWVYFCSTPGGQQQLFIVGHMGLILALLHKRRNMTGKCTRCNNYKVHFKCEDSQIQCNILIRKTHVLLIKQAHINQNQSFWHFVTNVIKTG